MSRTCQHCHAYLARKPTRIVQEIERDEDDRGDPRGGDYSVHVVQVLREIEVRECPRCGEENREEATP